MSRTDVILYVAFWTLYGPLAVGMWWSQDVGLIWLGIVLLAGLGMILSFLYFKLPYKQPPPSEAGDEFLGFRNLFSDGGDAL